MFSFSLKRIFDYLNYYILRPHRKGHGIHSPFLFDFVNHVLRMKNRTSLKEISNLKKQHYRDFSTIVIEDFGAGSKINKSNTRKLSDIARYSASSVKKGKLLYNMVKHYRPKSIIELGTSLGFGTMYLAKGNSNANIYSIEGSKNLSELAVENYKKLHLNNINILTGQFDTIFPELLEKMGTCDMLFIDGNHKKENTLLYFHTFLNFARQGSIVIIDDIRWSRGMYEAWLEICNNPELSLSVDLLDIGIVFFNHKIIKQHFRIYY